MKWTVLLRLLGCTVLGCTVLGCTVLGCTVLGCALLGCERRPAPTPSKTARPADHTPTFGVAHDLAERVDCARCHGPDPCARCHTTMAPRDHLPGFARGPHAFAARRDPDRCATCHQTSFCADCH